MRKIIIITGGLIFLLFCSITTLAQQDSVNLFEVDFETLMQMDVTVASKKSEDIYRAPGVITVVTREEIQNFDARNLGDVLAKLPSTMFISANYFTDNVVQMRGQSLTPYNNHVLFLLNGRPMRDPISGGLNSALFASFPVGIIQRIEVIRGPGSVLYGSAAFSGVINIVTQAEQDQNQSSAHLAYGSYNELKAGAAINGKSGDLDFSFGIDYQKNEGPEYEFTDFTGVKSKDKFNRSSYGTVLSANYEGLSANMSYLEFHPYALDGADVKWSPETALKENRNTAFMADLGYTHRLSDQWSASLNLTYNRTNWTMLAGANTIAEDKLAEFTLRGNPSAKLNILLGGTIEQDHSFEGAALQGQRTLMGNIYTQIDYTIAEKFKLIGGIQANKIEEVDVNLSPRLGLVANLNQNFGFKALFSTAFRKGYPWETASSISVFKGNESLAPELIHTTELQFFYRNDKVQLSATAYYSQMSHIIIRNTHFKANGDFDYLRYENGGKHNFYGVEIDGKIQLADNLFFTGSASYQQNETEAGVENANLHPNLMVKGGILYTTKALNFGIFNAYYGEPTQVYEVEPSVNNVNPKPEAFDLLSAKITFKPSNLLGWNTDVRIFGEFYNLLNQEVYYPEYTSKSVNSLLPLQKEMNFRVGVSLQFE